MILIGIDPGQSGAVATLKPSWEGLTTTAIVMPESVLYFAEYLGRHACGKNAHIFIEKAQSFPKQGIASAFNYGVHFGELLGVIQALGLSHTLVSPRTWTKVMHQGTKDDEPKKRSLEACRRIFPNIKLEATERSKRAHDGIVDALLLAEYGRRQLGGPT